MSEPLAALSQDWLLPGLERVPPDSVALLEPNQRFIEAFMLGLNVEMGRELLWRDFVVRDPRATYFRRFWRAANPQASGRRHRAASPSGATARLGENVPAGTPGAARSRWCCWCAAPCSAAIRAPSSTPCPRSRWATGASPGPQAGEVQPLFRGALQPDVTFFGFDLDPALATGDPGWYFVIQQQPTEPRFGFDVEMDFGAATHVPLARAARGPCPAPRHDVGLQRGPHGADHAPAAGARGDPRVRADQT